MLFKKILRSIKGSCSRNYVVCSVEVESYCKGLRKLVSNFADSVRRKIKNMAQEAGYVHNWILCLDYIALLFNKSP